MRPGVLSASSVPLFFTQSSLLVAGLLALVLLGMVLASLLANYLQGGWIFAPSRMLPDFTHIQLSKGFQRLFSGRSLVELAKSLLKVVIIGLVVWLFLKGKFASFLSLVHLDAGQIAHQLNTAAFQVSTRILMVLLILGALDYAYQRYQYEKNLRMTKQEVKDEMRQVEGDPKVKARMRSLMRQLTSKRMMAAVPQADVVITNPTHLAVALKYESGRMLAPQVVAKGQGFVALKIIALAQEAGVPRLENQPLAQALYRQVEVGEAIPTSLYRAVAEVLAYVYSLRTAAGGRP
jgi:flagellar biosynthetic protein FlhB